MNTGEQKWKKVETIQIKYTLNQREYSTVPAMLKKNTPLTETHVKKVTNTFASPKGQAVFAKLLFSFISFGNNGISSSTSKGN
jgi:hypothetical protein